MRSRVIVLALLVTASCVRSDVHYEVGLLPNNLPAVVFRARILDRDTLEPIAGLVARRIDGQVERTTDADGLLEFPLELSRFGACIPFADGSGVACTKDDPETTRFVLRGAHISPLMIAPEKYRPWDETTTLLAWRCASIAGVWRDAHGRPVAKSKLALKSTAILPFDCEEQFADLEIATDERGAFRVDGVAARVLWTFRAADEKDKFVPLVGGDFVLAPGEQRVVDLRSAALSRLTGIVRDAQGRPARAAGVRISNPEGSLVAETGADGKFAFERIGSGRFEIRALYPDNYDASFGCFTTVDMTSADRSRHLELRLLPLMEIDGRVLDAHRAPSSDAEVWFEPETQPYSGRQSVEPDGRFRVSVFPGKCRLIATGEARLPWGAVRSAQSGEHGVTLTLEPIGSMRGRVIADSSLEDARVELHVRLLVERPRDATLHNGCDEREQQIESGRDTFELTGLPPGRYAVKAVIRDRQVSAEHIVTVAATQTTACPDLVLKPSAKLWLIHAPGLERTAIEVWCGAELCARPELVGERLEVLQVPAAPLRIVAPAFREQRIELGPGEQRLVGVGYAR